MKHSEWDWRMSTLKAPAIIALLSVMVFACEKRESGAGQESPEREPVTVKTITAGYSKIEPELSSFGSLSFLSKTDISPPVEGVIKAIYAEEGDRIRKDELLAELENTQLEIRATQAETSLAQARAALNLSEANYREGLLQAEARFLSIEKMELAIKQKDLELETLKTDLSKKEQLLEVDGVTDDQVEKLKLSLKAAQTDYETTIMDLEIKRIGFRDEDIRALGYEVPYAEATKRKLLRELNCLTLKAEVDVSRAGLEAAEQEVKSLNLLLKELRVLSPASGVLGARYLEPGERVAAGTKLFTIFMEDKVYAVFPVQERDALLVREGQEVRVVLPALKDEERVARVTLVSPMLDPQSGNIIIKAIMNNPDGKLKPGMFVRVRLIHGKPENRILLPLTCLVGKEGDKAEVFAASGGRVFKRTLVLGEESKGFVEALSGIEEGDLVVDFPPPLLREGDNVLVD